MNVARLENKSVTLVERSTPVPAEGEALIKVRTAGICNTDIELYEGYYGFAGIPGHEFVGTVSEAPDAPDMVGKRVCADINAGCGTCPLCLAGDARHCPDRRVLGIVHMDGAFAEYVAVPITCLYEVDDAISDDMAAFAEPLAAALEIGRQIHITGDMRVLVLGDGKLGLLIALALRLQCPGLILVGKHEEKLALAAAQGVRTEYVPDPSELAEPAGSFLSKHGKFDLTVEATGSPKGLDCAMALTRPEGTIVAKTTSHKPSELDLARLVVDEITLTGSRCGDIGLALDYLASGLIDVRPLIAARYPFKDFAAAFEHARTPGTLKVLVDFPENN